MPAVQTIPLFRSDPAAQQRRIASEEEIARRRALADALRQRDYGVIESPWEGAAMLADTVFAGLANRRADREEQARRDAYVQALGGLYSGTGAPNPAAMRQVLELDPKLGMQLIMDERERVYNEQRQAEAQRRADEERDYERSRPLNIGGRLVDPNTYETVYEPPTRPERFGTKIEPGPDGTPHEYALYEEFIDGKPVVTKEDLGPAMPTRSDRPTPYTPEARLRADIEAGYLPPDAANTPSTPQFRSLTDPAERAAYGIPEKDTRPYQVGPDGELKVIGGAGVNVNIGGAEREAAAEQRQQLTGNIVLDEIDRAKAIIEGSPTWTTGAIGTVAARVPGTPAHNLDKLLDTIKANSSFEQLQAMRAASPTGGALGNVTERELALLQAVIGSVEQSQSSEQLLYNLDRLEKVYQDIIHGPGGGETNNTPPPPDAEGWQTLPNGVRIRQVP